MWNQYIYFFLVSKLCWINATVDFYDYKNAWLFHFDKTTADYYRSHNKKQIAKESMNFLSIFKTIWKY